MKVFVLLIFFISIFVCIAAFFLFLRWILKRVRIEITKEKSAGPMTAEEIIKRAEFSRINSTRRAGSDRALFKTLKWYVLLGVGIICIPENISESILEISSMDEFFIDFLPAISSLSQLSPYPSTMQLYLVMMWLLVFLFSIKILPCWDVHIFRMSFLRLLLSCFIFLPIPLLFGYSFGFHEFSIEKFHNMSFGRGKSLVSALTQFRFGTATAGSIIFCTLAAAFSIEIYLLKFFVNKYILKNNK